MNREIKSEAVEWCEEAEIMLSQAAHNCSIQDLKNQVECGATLFKLTLNDELIGYYILRIDNLNQWSEAVFVAGAGNHQDFDVTTTAVLIAETQVLNCKYLRIHTARAGLAKLISKIGFDVEEIVMRKELA